MLRAFVHTALTVILAERFSRNTQLAQNLAPVFCKATCYTLKVGDGTLKSTQAYCAVIGVPVDISVKWKVQHKGIIVVQSLHDTPDNFLCFLPLIWLIWLLLLQNLINAVIMLFDAFL